MQFMIYLLDQFFIKLGLSWLKLLLLLPACQLQPLCFLLFFQVDFPLISRLPILLSSYLFSSYFLSFEQLINHLNFIIIFHSNLFFLHWQPTLTEVTRAQHLLSLSVLFWKVFSLGLACSRLLEWSRMVRVILLSHLHCHNQNHYQNYLPILLLLLSWFFLYLGYRLLLLCSLLFGFFVLSELREQSFFIVSQF